MKSAAEPIERKRLTDQVVDRLVLLIVNKKLKNGDKLPTEHKLMKQFGVGRSSLREAMGTLTLTGVLSSRAGYGTFVNVSQNSFSSKRLAWRVSLGQEKIEELVETRIILEQAIAGLAAARCGEIEIAETKRELDLFELALKSNTRTAQVKADLLFHFALAKASHNATLIRFLSELSNLMRLWMKQTIRAGSIYSTSALLEDHREIVHAIEEHDSERAQKAMRKHLEMSARNLSFMVLHKQLLSFSV
jgi:GntR family transcriptional repressor for pyruvate dehydrogenase complex